MAESLNLQANTATMTFAELAASYVALAGNYVTMFSQSVQAAGLDSVPLTLGGDIVPAAGVFTVGEVGDAVGLFLTSIGVYLDQSQIT